MAYSDFTLQTVQKKFGLTISEQVDIFAAIPEVNYSNFLAETLRFNLTG